MSRNKIERAIANLRVHASIARNWDDADVVLTLKTLERKEQPKLKQIASDNVPIYSIKTNTTTQIQAALRDVFNLGSIDHEELALREAEEAIYQVLLTNAGDRAFAADVVRAAHAAPAGGALSPAVAQYRPRAEPPRQDL